jgi:antitoxin component of MazEF toxin-antitoxin module
MELIFEIAQDGSITLPAGLLKGLKLLPGDEMRVVETDGALVLVPRPRSVYELALEIEAALNQAGITMDEMFAGLRE